MICPICSNETIHGCIGGKIDNLPCTNLATSSTVTDTVGSVLDTADDVLTSVSSVVIDVASGVGSAVIDVASGIVVDVIGGIFSSLFDD